MLWLGTSGNGASLQHEEEATGDVRAAVSMATGKRPSVSQRARPIFFQSLGVLDQTTREAKHFFKGKQGTGSV